MPAYAYPITIRRNKLTIQFDELVKIENDSLTLSDLQFVGDDSFSIHAGELGEPSYTVSVSRSRLETDDELAARVTREESYMAEYHRRSKPPSKERP